MKFETFSMPKNKKILVTNRKIEIPIITINDKTSAVIRIICPSLTKDLESWLTLDYLFESKQPVTLETSWDYFGLLYKICENRQRTIGVVRPRFLESLASPEINKLLGFV